MTNEDIVFRRAKSNDLKGVTKIFVEEFAKEPYHENWDYEKALSKIKEYLKEGLCFVAISNEEVVGFIIFRGIIWNDGLHLFVDEIVVKDQFQGKGIGKQLMNLAEKEYTQHGAILAELYCHKKSNSFKFYKKIGYYETDNVVMNKKLK
jgi:aminoglycoside 6'-N-acetyltransferase I